MPSPGISFGDLAVFVAVLVVVAVFLLAVRSILKRAEALDPPAAPQRRPAEGARRSEESRAMGGQPSGSSQSASR